MPARFRDIKRALLGMGFAVDSPDGGSHWKVRDRAGKLYPLPCHNGERSEITDKYLRALCRTFDIDYNDFLGRL